MTRQSWLRFAAQNGDLVLDELAAADCEVSLHAFVVNCWDILHPMRPFVDGWAVRAMLEHYQAVVEGRIRDIVVNVPPGFSKSLSLMFMRAWAWGPHKRPDLQFINWSYAEELPVRDNLRLRRIIQSDFYQRHWGSVFELAGDQNEKVLIANNHSGYSLAAGIHGGGTGHRGDIISIDDAHKVHEAESTTKREFAVGWFSHTFPSRTNDANARKIIQGQRVHEADVSAAALSDPKLGYEHLCIPMEWEAGHPHVSRTLLGFVDPRSEEGALAWEERFPRVEVDKLKSSLRLRGGDYAVAGQLQQRPTPKGGGQFRRADFHVIDRPPDLRGWRIARGWDLAGTSKKKNPLAAYTAGIKVAISPQGHLCILDAVRIQGAPHEVDQLVKSTTNSDGPRVPQDIPIDPGQAGIAQAAAFARLLSGSLLFTSPESGSKIDRAQPFRAQVSSGNVRIVRAPWTDAYLAEAEAFPGSYMDQIDATSRAYSRLLRMGGNVGPVSAPEEIRL